ncbi:U5 small nuclear ribonucleoprotein 40 kDa protein (macronuclear) [Tetrahymena thermophila SB210]|uniref:U5 small nuclear ribonucleoprotein 40 kDa protein n=1 Tax=Tetrahymena thermophila (strain SB210) TaxID=312017 RepID=Q23ZD6_TETTS|nr:U5 small nuclear ribonucleoprotein 40 kDa protein [Tetrahymena thermophila SB210]EAS01921.1 U5 small nuclear ribonucleoprotein 40 kDa protein [Tetrahymena thermophila SB210]|eukprot:XP_001022166.1 U5 small nuclear ribonucleoprotein 40 kDa protein [Tetrahymena thermophila SB210]
MDLGSASILPRFRNEGDKKFSSTQFIQSHVPHLLSENNQQLMVVDNNNESAMQEENKPVTKKLFTPNVQLTGHVSEVLCVKFSPCGDYLATAGFDKQILLWDIYNNCKNFGVLKNHTNAILDLHFSADGQKLYSASADKSVNVWDFNQMKSIKKLKGQENTSFVNTCHPARRGPDMLVSGSDDGCVMLWDLRQKAPAQVIPSKIPVTSVSFNDTADKIFIAGVDNDVKVLDLRKKIIDYVLFGHTDTITGISLSHDGSYLLTNSMDQTVRCFDVRPHVTNNRCVKIFQGNRHSHERNLLRVSWNPDGDYCTAGSSDKFLYIWDTATKQIVQRLGGHNGSVNDVQFSPTDNLIASASSDKTVIIGELPQFKI